MSSADFRLGEVSRAIGAAVAAVGPSPVSHVFLIGSATTKEICDITGTSDIDLLLLVEPGTSEDECEHIKERLRTELQVGPFSSKPAGLRCRYAHELKTFSRYMALQGYHSSLSVSVFSAGEQVQLPDFERFRATRGEFLCVLGECLWGELRSQAVDNPDTDVQIYLEAKNALAYLNLLLVAEGVFLPTHAERVAEWEATHCVGSRQLHVALAAKTGLGHKAERQDLTSLTAMLRQRAIDVVESLKRADDGMDPMQFWSTFSGLDMTDSRHNEAFRICDSLASLVSGRQPTTRQISPSTCAGFINSLGLESKRAAVSRIHTHRITESQASRRDWGHKRLT